MRLRRTWLAALAAGLALLPRPAGGFSIASGFSESCHERLALAALAVVIEGRDLNGITLPSDDLWRRVAADLGAAVLESAGRSASETLTDPQKFVLYSAVVGVRSPDTGGHSVSNLAQLRQAQVDPDPESQHLHCLRAASEDGYPGDLSVLDGSERLIRQALADAAVAALPGVGGNVTVPLYLDFYGQLAVEVDRASYLVGRALHTLQDCYAHTLRSADARTVYTVLNYLDAISGALDEARDGMNHSDTLDDCRRQELAPVVERVARVGVALARAAVAGMYTADQTLLDRGFAPCPPGETDPTTCEWLHYQPACDVRDPASAGCCSAGNAYCGSPYLTVAQEKLSQPYLAEVLSCAAAPGLRRSSALAPLLPAVLVLGLLVRRRSRRARTAPRWLSMLATLAALVPAPARAAAEPGSSPPSWFATAEGHFSLLSDIPGRSYLDITIGYALRGGYRWGPWGLLAQIERNHWLPTELSHDLEPGALNVGIGVERLALHGHLRLSVTAGPSILWFSTALDEKGTVGLFVDLRPAGLRWSPLRRLALVFDPLSLCLVAPVLGSPGIRQLEYRTLLGAELTP